jgi:hypothetical protein
MDSRFISEPSAVISGPAAWLLARLLRSPDVARVLACPPSWIERGQVIDMVTTVDLAARAFEASITAPKRGESTSLGAVVAHSAADWTTKETAEFLTISVRRAQELAPDLGGRRAGRQWRIPATAVRAYEQRKAKRAA